MRAQSAHDAAIAAIAERQYGVVTYEQLLLLGLDRGRIARRVAAGRLHRLHRGVYAVGHAAPRDELRWTAAVFACGPGAVLSHCSAAVLWGLRRSSEMRVHVTVPTRSGRRRTDVVVHRAALDDADRTAHRGIPVTTPERTVADLVPELSERELTRAVREAQFLGLYDPGAMDALLERRPSRPLRALAADVAPTQSALEDALLRLCARHRLPRPRTQVRLHGRRVDFLWVEQRVVVEVDGGPAIADARRSRPIARARTSSSWRVTPCCASRGRTSCIGRPRRRA
jgi:very-short-patch-repair endonuclease